MGDEQVRVVGFDELVDGTRKLARNLEDAAPATFGHVADQKAQEVAGSVPKRTGRLAASVTADHDRQGAIVGMGGPNVPYAGWIEFGGTRGRPYMPRGRYLYPTAKAAGPQLVVAGNRMADHEIGRMTWPRPS